MNHTGSGEDLKNSQIVGSFEAYRHNATIVPCESSAASYTCITA
jgi:hypothetical protein